MGARGHREDSVGFLIRNKFELNRKEEWGELNENSEGLLLSVIHIRLKREGPRSQGTKVPRFQDLKVPRSHCPNGSKSKLSPTDSFILKELLRISPKLRKFGCISLGVVGVVMCFSPTESHRPIGEQKEKYVETSSGSGKFYPNPRRISGPKAQVRSPQKETNI